jgi:acetylornithine deacetylase
MARLTVPGARQTLLFEAHMDTVPGDSMGERAWRPEVRDGRLYGRGSCDTKGSLAAMLVALELLLARRGELNMHVALLATVDEELQFTGIRHFVDSDERVEAAVVGEPTDLRVVIAHKGCLRVRVSTLGRAAHSARPEVGINAIDHMADVLYALRGLQERLPARQHPLVGSPTLSVGIIEGGTGVNVVPDRCTIDVDRRTIPGEGMESALAEIDALLADVRRSRPDVRLELSPPTTEDWPLDTPVDAAVVQAAQAACRALGRPDALLGVPYSTDASKLWALREVPSIVLGPGSITQAHTADEFVPVAHLSAAAEIYERTALELSEQLSGRS